MDQRFNEFDSHPGHLIRRLQQIAVAVFMDETQAWGLTPVQYAALSAVLRHPGVDQRTLARLIGFDTSTIGSVIDRLEARQLMLRSNSPADRRVRLLHVTPEGQALLDTVEPAVQRAQLRMLDPLPPERRAQLMELLTFLVHENDELARAPTAAVGRPATRRGQAAD